MADSGTRYTDKQIKELESRFREVYSEAERDINRKMKDFNEKYKVKEAKYAKQVADGKITQEQFDSWKKGQVFQGKQWQAKKESIQQVLHNSNVIAAKLANQQAVGVMQANINFSSFDMEKGMGVNFGFNVYDRTTVLNLIANEPNLLPHYIPKAGLDAQWNSKMITRQITQGIIQGERIDQITARLAKVTASRNEESMKTHARTLMTAAQNQGRLISYQNAAKLGIDLEKEWMATLDGHTRDSHADVDGEKQPVEHKFSNDCMYPGDPGGPPAEVYNCRCTMVSDIKKYPSAYQRRDNIDGKLIKNMNYRDWYKSKGKTHETATKVLNAAKRAEKAVTRDLLLASALGDGELEGLDFRFKGRGSLERKIVDKSAKKGISQDEYAQQITDALRYTNMSDPDHLTDDFNLMKQSLESKGYSMVEVANTLWDENAEYRGINTLVQTPNGYTFELQFHTPQSLEIKEVNHKLYEEQRLATTSEEEKERLGLEMIKNAKSITTPKDVETIVNKYLDNPIKQW